MCEGFSRQMEKDFPELHRVRGHYVTRCGISHPHWWCETADGEVVDPTVAQFTPGGVYEKFEGPDPIGRCYECGELVFEDKGGGRDFCDDLCHRRYVSYLESGGSL